MSRRAAPLAPVPPPRGRPTKSGGVGTRTLRGLVDRFLTGLARLALRAFFRDVQVEGRSHVPHDRPTLVVANHFYGFMDPVMLIQVFGRLPRFLATARFWRSDLLRPLLALAGMIPVSRRQDGGDARTNRSAFAACVRSLGAGELVGLFPEGVTHDDPTLRRIRSGAARIALQAVEEGVHDLVIVPVGLAYDDKLALRSRVLAQIGPPIEVDRVLAALPAGARRELVRALTTVIGERLGTVSPAFGDRREAAVLRRAALIFLRTHRKAVGEEVGLGEQEAVARRLARGGDEQWERVAAALARYTLDLDLVGLDDRQVVPGFHAPALLRETAWTALVLALLAPLALFGVLWNAVPYWCVKVSGRMVESPVTKGTVRLSTALGVFPLMWLLVVLLDPFRGALAGLAVFLLAPLLGLIAVGVSERAVAVYRAWQGWIALTERRARVEALRASRAAVVGAVGEQL